MKESISKGTIIRGLCLALSFANIVLKATGHELLPIDDAMINDLVSDAWIIGAAAWGYYKNNSFSKSAIKSDKIMKRLKFVSKAEKKGYTVTSNEADQNSISAILYENSPVQATDEQIAEAAKAEAEEVQDA